MDNKYKELVFTHHALEKLKQRVISQGDAWLAWKNPDQSRYAKSKGAWIYYKTVKGNRIEVVAKKDINREWIILSVWSKKL